MIPIRRLFPTGPALIAVLTAGLLLPALGTAQRTEAPLSAGEAARLLEQGSWGPTLAAVQDAQSKGVDGWLNEQFAAPVSTFADQALLNAKGNSNGDLTPVLRTFYQNALNNPDQLRQRVAFALSQIWVISQLGVNDAQGFPPIMRIFQARAFDNYENLMTDVTLNPGMGVFLNMVNNRKADPAKNTAPNENYARELMQLFTLGLNQLNQDGTPVLDSNGNPAPSYTQDTVTNLSRVLTGWTYPTMPGAAVKGTNPRYFIGAMVPTEAEHDMTAKTIFGVNLPAGQTAEQDLQQALHIIFEQPGLPPFISKQLIQHLVTSNPSPGYVGRVAAVFVDNGSGVRGDLKAVVTAILTDREARAPEWQWNRTENVVGHMKEPILFVTSLLRGLNGQLSDTSTVYNLSTALGESLFYAPSVFSYFSPQYSIGYNEEAPEFQIYSTQTAATRINIVASVVYAGKIGTGTTFDISSFAASGANPPQLLTQIDTLFFHGHMSPELRDAITGAMEAQSKPTAKAETALYLALSSGEFQISY